MASRLARLRAFGAWLIPFGPSTRLGDAAPVPLVFDNDPPGELAGVGAPFDDDASLLCTDFDGVRSSTPGVDLMGWIVGRSGKAQGESGVMSEGIVLWTFTSIADAVGRKGTLSLSFMTGGDLVNLFDTCDPDEPGRLGSKGSPIA